MIEAVVDCMVRDIYFIKIISVYLVCFGKSKALEESCKDSCKLF